MNVVQLEIQLLHVGDTQRQRFHEKISNSSALGGRTSVIFYVEKIPHEDTSLMD